MNKSNIVIYTLFLCIGAGHPYRSQNLNITPTFEAKSYINLTDSRKQEYEAFKFEPQKISRVRQMPINLGIMFDLVLKNNNAISFGLMQESPQIGYFVYLTSYESTAQLYYPNNLGVTVSAPAMKLPLKFDIKLKDSQVGDSKFRVQKRLQVGLALYYQRYKKITESTFEEIVIDSGKWVSVRSGQFINPYKALILSLSYSWNFSRNNRQLFAFTIFGDYSGAKVMSQSVLVTHNDVSRINLYSFSTHSTASGIGMRVSTPIRVWKHKNWMANPEREFSNQ